MDTVGKGDWAMRQHKRRLSKAKSFELLAPLYIITELGKAINIRTHVIEAQTTKAIIKSALHLLPRAYREEGTAMFYEEEEENKIRLAFEYFSGGIYYRVRRGLLFLKSIKINRVA